ncbi:MAG: putative binding protein component of ABC iron transporter [Candidatus Tectimicrobiota bacterium]|nr:MAG: putative binding protein component of ABC iron transporter [Candidatus Tectomicrobia bacterium]
MGRGRLFCSLVGLVGLALMLPAAEAAEVVVYSSRIEQLIKPMFDAFTAASGIPVRYFTASEAELIERLKAEGANTPADLFMTVDAGNLWLAEQAGLLQGVASPVIARHIPAHLRAKDNAWVGLSVRARPIMYSSERVMPEELSTYEALGDPKWRGRLCLRTSRKVYTQSLVAAMLKALGEARTEAVLRAWMANEPRIFNSDTKMLEAIAAGQCDVTIANTYYLARLKAKDPDFPVAVFWPNQQDRGVHVNISGAGITRHAKHRQEALRLLEFLSGPEAQRLYADANYEYPANPAVKPHPLIAAWGTFKADTVDVAVFGELQAAAVKLLDRVGYR